MKWGHKIGIGALATVIITLLLSASSVMAARLTSPNYQLNTTTGSSFGGMTGSGSYQLRSTGGEAVIGEGAGGSYKLTQAPPADEVPSLTLSLSSESVALGSLTSGASQTANFSVQLESTGANYSLAIAQNHPLQTSDGVATIPGIDASTMQPAVWQEGSTLGLGYTILSAPQLASKWQGGDAYAALPATATTFYTGSGAGQASLTIGMRGDVDNQQPPGEYRNTVTLTGTVTP